MAHKAGQKITIVGGTGFVGQALGQTLARQGYSLTVTTRNPENWIGQMSFPCTLVGWDPMGGPFPSDNLHRPDVVINLAGAGIGDQRWTEEYKKTLRDSRIVTTQKIAEALASRDSGAPSNNPVRLIQASAVGFYGSRGDEILVEESPRGKGFLADLCVDWEAQALKAQGKNCQVTIVRIGVVLGWGSGFLKTLIPLYMRGMGASLGSGKQWVPWIAIDDLTEIFAHAAAGWGAGRVINATAPDPITFEELHRAVASRYGLQVSPTVPSFALRGILGQQAEIALNSQRAIPSRLLGTQAQEGSGTTDKTPFRFKYPSLKETMNKLFTDDYDKNSYHLFSQQWVPYRREEIWPFFTDENNLEKLTPPLLHFKVVGKTTAQIEEGTQIRYDLKLHGIPLKWESKIRTWEPTTHFVDHQLKGPYSLWDHLHQFEDLAGGTLMTDHVRFRLPMGKIGFLAASPFVLKDLDRIFTYRRKQISEIFPQKKNL
jgi:uncharacterized protein (TIGR01777 family)